MCIDLRHTGSLHVFLHILRSRTFLVGDTQRGPHIVSERQRAERGSDGPGEKRKSKNAIPQRTKWAISQTFDIYLTFI